ncbi:glycoside hydrolase family 13 protein [Salinarimonas ramus]|uniref:Oligo-1,6-glucosidase n=1 Tax=Salinarimonas ramus TaxID=690164 RepID=A0A917QIN4_9HYPH|nr:alpha-glucosidase [Salinarimonas ramus]GGK53097.1 oligo-1,6-glucosidase [Salinarimonas ramus]
MAGDPTCNGHVRHWWKEAVFYQVWPRSFQDTNGDGIGDIPGVIARLDHIAGLGVDAIWLSPHYDSPNVDNGYDVRDYVSVAAEFGMMADFDRLLAETKARGMRLIVDMVVNHSSDEHAWFVESRAARDSDKRDFYVWHPGREGGTKPPNDWRSFFGGSAWSRDATTGDWYMHLFHEKQPDLNWESAAAREAIFEAMRFWLDKGVDGFRLDVIAFVSKEPGLPDYPPRHRKAPEYYHADGPRLMEHLTRMREEVYRGADKVAVGEAFGVTFEQAARLVAEGTGPLDMLIHFDAVRIDRAEGWRWKPFTLPDLKRVFSEQERLMGRTAWRTICLSNHDNPRLVSHFGDTSTPALRRRSAILLATLILTLKGTPFVYQGDEIGMTNYPFARIEEYDDVEAKGAWTDHVETGAVAAEEFLENMWRTTRDHARTPMQWDASPTGGFTTGTPWFHVHPDVGVINAATERADEGSIYHGYRRLIALRKATPPLVYGDYADLAPDDPRLFVFERRIGEEACLVALNMSSEDATLTVPERFVGAAPLMAEGAEPAGDAAAPLGGEIMLAPWESRIWRTTEG